MKKLKEFIEKRTILLSMLCVCIASLIITVFAFFIKKENNILKEEIRIFKAIHFVKNDRNKNNFNIDNIRIELEKYKVKYIDIALAQFLYETGYESGKCSDILCLGNNLFAMKVSYVRPNVSDGSFEPKGGGHYAYYSNWERSVLDYALYQSHYINKNTTRKSWLMFLEKKYSKTKGYSKKITEIIKTRKL